MLAGRAAELKQQRHDGGDDEEIDEAAAQDGRLSALGARQGV